MSKRSKAKKKQALSVSKDESGMEYPLDIWFLISEYIQPEAVGKFASICKSSYYVVQTGKFWFSLYKRFYKPVPNLPEKLKPEFMVQLCGLRAYVIRTLHYTYFSSLKKVNRPYLDQDQPHTLVKRRCNLMWHKSIENRWYFYFKLEEVTDRRSYSRIENINSWDCDIVSDDNYSFDDVWKNPEENCRILRVTCINYAMIPLVAGLILQSVKVDLSPGFKYHRITLNFGSTYIPKTPTHTITLSQVVDYKVLDWWNPCYPHQDKIDFFMPFTESWDS
ncbi:transmembrane protein 183 [Chelonus insularis]|uniref:transmembrane protein 183 n=1 Tax=Chelonus insularis TaxID=460826 RepID=UPI001589264D|nr:transmembrane protein 183 [Chelonus insularis]